MAKEWAKKFYASKAWKKCRDNYFESKQGLCERCGNPGKIVHHKDELTQQNINNPYVTLNWDNLELVCQDCHNKEHHGNDDWVIRCGLGFDDDGNLIEIYKNI